MAWAKITRTWPDDSTLVCVVGSDLDSVDEVYQAAAALDKLAAPTAADDEAEQ